MISSVAISRSLGGCTAIACDLIPKALELSRNHALIFEGLGQTFLAGLAWRFGAQNLGARSEAPLDGKALTLRATANKIKQWNAKGHEIGSTAYLVSGICNTAIGCHQSRIFNLRTVYPSLRVLGSGLFIAAMMITIERYMEVYNEAARVLATNPGPAAIPALKQAQRSAVLGVIGVIAVLIDSLTVIFALSPALFISFGIIAGITNVIKFLYDYRYERFVLRPALAKENL